MHARILIVLGFFKASSFILTVFTVCVGRAVNLHAMHNLFELCNILSPSLQRKHSFRIENWSDQMRGLKRETFFLPVCSEQRNVKHLEDFIAEVERRERQSEVQRPEIPGGPNACGYYDQQSAEK